MDTHDPEFHPILGKLLAIMTVQFGDNQSDDITIYENDDPNKLAEEFVQKNSFDISILEIIVENIKINKNLAYEEYQKNPCNFKVQKDSDVNNCTEAEIIQSQQQSYQKENLQLQQNDSNNQTLSKQNDLNNYNYNDNEQNQSQRNDNFSDKSYECIFNKDVLPTFSYIENITLDSEFPNQQDIQNNQIDSQENQSIQQKEQDAPKEIIQKIINNPDNSDAPINKFEKIKNQFKRNKSPIQQEISNSSPNISLQNSHQYNEQQCQEQQYEQQDHFDLSSIKKQIIYDSPQITKIEFSQKKEINQQQKSPCYVSSSQSTIASMKQKEFGYIDKMIQKSYQTQFANNSNNSYKILYNTENDQKPFKPQISKRSQQIINEKNKDKSPAFQRLHTKQTRNISPLANIILQNENIDYDSQIRSSLSSKNVTRKASNFELMESNNLNLIILKAKNILIFNSYLENAHGSKKT